MNSNTQRITERQSFEESHFLLLDGCDNNTSSSTRIASPTPPGKHEQSLQASLLTVNWIHRLVWQVTVGSYECQECVSPTWNFVKMPKVFMIRKRPSCDDGCSPSTRKIPRWHSRQVTVEKALELWQNKNVLFEQGKQLISLLAR
ncbi:hypothetical protein C0Q70_06433 [Pomacea canaliculata]|uniref:Uncharacterized protein n=1 Tax=Pomacea canaliculata TaxID=400727 RepID=A0A2T7PP03_POMCA|nr:hypothetical protein C0Q70_06433 [Pomacea canaliculata]